MLDGGSGVWTAAGEGSDGTTGNGGGDSSGTTAAWVVLVVWPADGGLRIVARVSLRHSSQQAAGSVHAQAIGAQ